MTIKNTEGLEHKQQCSARFIYTHISIHLSSFTILSAKELTEFGGIIKCIFPVFSVKPNLPKRPCLTSMPGKLGSAKPSWRNKWLLHRNTKTVHCQSSVRGYALHTPLEAKTDSPSEPGVSEGGSSLLFLLFPEKATRMGEGRNGQETSVLLERSCTHYQQHFFTHFKTYQPLKNPTTVAEKIFFL